MRISHPHSQSRCFIELAQLRVFLAAGDCAHTDLTRQRARRQPVPNEKFLKFSPRGLKSLAYTLSFWRLIMKDIVSANWVLIPKFCELKGYTVNAVRAKIKNGIWKEGNLWRKGPDNRIVIDVNAVNRWMGGTNV